MGGVPCLIKRNAILEFDSVPTQPAQQAKFDTQIRKLCTEVAQDISNDTDQSMAVCTILAKTTFTMEDRAKLLDVVESLYEDYSP